MVTKFFDNGIPSLFFNYDTGAPFSSCTFCEKKMTSETKYAVEKMIHQNTVMQIREIVYEYAMCWDCATALGGDISQESRLAIQQLYNEHGDILMRKLDYLHRTKKYTIDSWLERCSLTGKEIRNCEEFSISGIIESGNLVYEQAPMVVSGQFMQKLHDVLSEETNKGFQGLRDKITDGSPSVEDLVYGPVPGFF